MPTPRVFADGHPELSTGSVLHTSFLLGTASGSVLLSRGARLLDYLNYTNMQAGFAYGSWPDGQLFDRQYFYVATPGATNNPTAVPTPEIMPANAPARVVRFQNRP